MKDSFEEEDEEEDEGEDWPPSYHPGQRAQRSRFRSPPKRTFAEEIEDSEESSEDEDTIQLVPVPQDNQPEKREDVQTSQTTQDQGTLFAGSESDVDTREE